MIRVKTYEPVEVTLDGKHKIQLRIKRLSVTENAEMERLFWRAMRMESDRVLLVRRPGEEQEQVVASAISDDHYEAFTRQLKSLEDTNLDRPADARLAEALALSRVLLAAVTPTDRFVISDEEIRRRRLIGLTDAERTEYERYKKQDDAAMRELLEHALTNYVVVPEGQIEVEASATGADGTASPVVVPVTTGRQLFDHFGAFTDMLIAVVREIRRNNTLGTDEKNASRSRSTSTLSSSERDQTAVGDKPETTAAPVAPVDSATTAAVMPTVASPSGPTVN